MRRRKDALFAVINIGNSYITGLLASKDSAGKVVPIIHCAQESGDGIKQGKIFNEDEVKTCISAIVDELSRHIGDDYSISSLYLGIEPVGMRMRQYSITHTEAEEKRNKVSRELIDQMRAEATERVEDGYVVIHTEKPRISVDDKPMEVNRLEGVTYRKKFSLSFPTIEVEQNILDQFTDLFEDLKLEIKGYIPMPIVEAQTSLSASDLSVGSAYVNIGGGSTSISIYQNGHLSGLYILPLGGKNITRDLTSYKLTWAEAEAIKREYGLLNDEETESKVIDINGSSSRGGKSVRLSDVIECIQARVTEILENVSHIIKQAGGEHLIADRYVSFGGGVTMLKGWEELGLERCMIRNEYLGEYLEDDVRFAQSSILALAYHARETSLKEIIREMDSLIEEPTPAPTLDEIVEPETSTQTRPVEQVRGIEIISREETEEEKRQGKEKKQTQSLWNKAFGTFNKKIEGVKKTFSAQAEGESADDNSDEED